jgi:hypothetical protein
MHDVIYRNIKICAF